MIALSGFFGFLLKPSLRFYLVGRLLSPQEKLRTGIPIPKGLGGTQHLTPLSIKPQRGVYVGALFTVPKDKQRSVQLVVS